MADWTQDDVDALKTAVASGILTVTYDGPPKRSITYQSLTQMRALLAEMVATVAAASGRKRFRKFATKKGFDS